jgi:hypothetical protein
MVTYNERGFSALELIIAVSLLGWVMLTSGIFLKRAFKSTSYMSDRTERLSSDIAASKFLFADLRYAGSSFDLLRMNTGAGRNFFDYIPDYGCQSDCTRLFRLNHSQNSSGKTNSIVFVVGVGKSAPTPISPATLYDVVGTPSVETTSELRIKKNLRETLEGLIADLKGKSATLLFYSPVRVRPAASPSSTPPRMVAFVAEVPTGSQSDIPKALSIEGMQDQIHPVTGSRLSDLDQFFRALPATGGRGSMVFVKMVQLIKYQIFTRRLSSRQVVGCLVRSVPVNFLFPNCASVCEAGSMSAPVAGCTLVGTRIRSVEFTRANVATPVISFRIESENVEFEQGTKERI